LQDYHQGYKGGQSLAKEKSHVDIYLDDVEKSKATPSVQVNRQSYQQRSSSLNREEEEPDEMKQTGVFNMVTLEDRRESIRSKRSRRDGTEAEARGSLKRMRTNDQSSTSRDKSKRSFKFKFWSRDKQQSTKKIDKKKPSEEEDARNSKLKSEIRESMPIVFNILNRE